MYSHFPYQLGEGVVPFYSSRESVFDEYGQRRMTFETLSYGPVRITWRLRSVGSHDEFVRILREHVPEGTQVLGLQLRILGRSKKHYTYSVLLWPPDCDGDGVVTRRLSYQWRTGLQRFSDYLVKTEDQLANGFRWLRDGITAEECSVQDESPARFTERIVQDLRLLEGDFDHTTWFGEIQFEESFYKAALDKGQFLLPTGEETLLKKVRVHYWGTRFGTLAESITKV